MAGRGNLSSLRSLFNWNSTWFCKTFYKNLLFRDLVINQYLSGIFYKLRFATSYFLIKNTFFNINFVEFDVFFLKNKNIRKFFFSIYSYLKWLSLFFYLLKKKITDRSKYLIDVFRTYKNKNKILRSWVKSFSKCNKTNLLNNIYLIRKDIVFIRKNIKTKIYSFIKKCSFLINQYRLSLKKNNSSKKINVLKKINNFLKRFFFFKCFTFSCIDYLINSFYGQDNYDVDICFTNNFKILGVSSLVSVLNTFLMYFFDRSIFFFRRHVLTIKQESNFLLLKTLYLWIESKKSNNFFIDLQNYICKSSLSTISNDYGNSFKGNVFFFDRLFFFFIFFRYYSFLFSKKNFNFLNLSDNIKISQVRLLRWYLFYDYKRIKDISYIYDYLSVKNEKISLVCSLWLELKFFFSRSILYLAKRRVLCDFNSSFYNKKGNFFFFITNTIKKLYYFMDKYSKKKNNTNLFFSNAVKYNFSDQKTNENLFLETLFYKYYTSLFRDIFLRIEKTLTIYTNSIFFIIPNLYFRYKPFITNSKIICDYVVFLLESRVSIGSVFSRIKKWQQNQIRLRIESESSSKGNRVWYWSNIPLSGLRIVCKGPKYKARRKRKTSYHTWLSDDQITGRMPLQSLNFQIDYFQSFAVLKQATIGIKVWTLFQFFDFDNMQ